MAKAVFSKAIPQPAGKIVKAAVMKADWARFQLDGGALVVYPPRREGTELPNMMTVWISEKKNG